MSEPGKGASYREVTFSAIIFAIIIGVVMNAAITYAGLKIGFTIGGSAIAAVLGFGVLRGVLRKGSILETNIAQTAASSINTSNSGIIFTVPVLFLIGLPLTAGSSDFWLITLAAVGGAILGAAFIIPLRKQMIEIDRLRFPTGMGVAAILKSPGAGAKKSIVLVAGIVIAAILFWPNIAHSLDLWNYGDIPLTVNGHKIFTNEEFDAGKLLRLPGQFELIFGLAPFALGAGYITGRAGLLVLAGGILAYFILTPMAYSLGWMPASIDASAAPGYGFSSFNRPLGIGLLLGGAIMGVIVSLPAIKAALKSVAEASKLKSGGDELGLKPLIFAVLGAAVLLFFAADFVAKDPVNQKDFFSGTSLVGESAPSAKVERQAFGYTIRFESDATASQWDGKSADEQRQILIDNNAKPGWLAGLPTHVRSAIIAVVGILWIWLAGIIIAQCTGMTDWSPISGMALLTVVLVMLLAGTGAVIGAVLIGAALCVAITLAADMMQDLRTGHLVGASPRRQQIVELSVVAIGPIVAMLTILIIAGANIKQGGPAFGPGTSTAAPQAQALQSVITGVQGGELPYALYGFGALLGALLGLGAFSGLGVLVGLSMYLPFAAIATYGVGCILNMIVAKIKGRRWAEEWGVPFAAGLIVGESLLAMLINTIVLLR